MKILLVAIQLLITRIDISTCGNWIIDIKNYFSTSKKSILDINNWFWMAAYGDISLVKIQLQISAIKLLLNCKLYIVDINNLILDINNSYPEKE